MLYTTTYSIQIINDFLHTGTDIFSHVVVIKRIINLEFGNSYSKIPLFETFNHLDNPKNFPKRINLKEWVGLKELN